MKPGQIWRLGTHQVLCGDATDRDQVGRLLPGRVAACAVTDPPYHVAYAEGARSRRRTRPIANDALDPAA